MRRAPSLFRLLVSMPIAACCSTTRVSIRGASARATASPMTPPPTTTQPTSAPCCCVEKLAAVRWAREATLPADTLCMLAAYYRNGLGRGRHCWLVWDSLHCESRTTLHAMAVTYRRRQDVAVGGASEYCLPSHHQATCGEANTTRSCCAFSEEKSVSAWFRLRAEGSSAEQQREAPGALAASARALHAASIPFAYAAGCAAAGLLAAAVRSLPPPAAACCYVAPPSPPPAGATFAPFFAGRFAHRASSPGAKWTVRAYFPDTRCSTSCCRWETSL